MTIPKILLIDIETAPIIMASWQLWEASAVWVERDTYIMCVAYKWSHEKTIHCLALPDYAGYEKNKHCDKKLSQDLWKLLDDADVVVAHNGNAFDIKKINSRLAVHGHHSPSSYKKVDTLQIARAAFKFDSNKLDNLGRYLGEGRKIPNTGAALWRGCVNGDPKSWRIMKRYNKQDVALLERCYDRLKGWAPNHPNLNIISGLSVCPTCQSTNVQRRGSQAVKSGSRPRFQCGDCGVVALGRRNQEESGVMDDDEDYPPEGGCIGTGSVHDLMATPTRKKIVKHPIGFIHFPDKPEAKIPRKGTKRPKLGTKKRRKR